MNEVPFADSYWVVPGRFLAGEYPGTREMDGKALAKLRGLLRAGITCWLDLTEAGELTPYRELLLGEAARQGITVEHRRYPIRDLSVTSPAQMSATLDALDACMTAARGVYLHCWGGIGRTGTVVGCYLVRHGMSGEAALAEIERLRRAVPDAHRPSPEMEEQVKMVKGWQIGR